MGRPIKQGVDYFPHDVDVTGKKTVATLEAKYGNDGYAFWFKLLELLGSRQGLFIDCNDESEWLFLVAKTRVDEVSAAKILDTLSRLGAIDPELWQNRIIWVQNLVNRLEDVYKKRKQELPARPEPSHSFRSENPEQTEVFGEISTQSKVNKSKVNKSKEKNIPPYNPPQGGSVAKEKRVTKREQRGEELNSLVDSLTPSESVREAAKVWLELRLQGKETEWPTSRAVEMAFEKVRGWGYSEQQARECFAQSAINGWKGLFPLDRSSPKTSRGQPRGMPKTEYGSVYDDLPEE